MSAVLGVPIIVGTAVIVALIGGSAFSGAARRRWRQLIRYLSVPLASVETAVVTIGGLAANAAVNDPDTWPRWLAWMPADPAAMTWLCLVVGVVLPAARAPVVLSRRPDIRFTRTAPHFPPPPAGLVDRPTELRETVRAVRRRRVGSTGPVTGLHGMGGFGKPDPGI